MAPSVIIADGVPTLMAALKDRCNYLYAERSDEAWRLHYFLDIVLYDGRRATTFILVANRTQLLMPT